MRLRPVLVALLSLVSTVALADPLVVSGCGSSIPPRVAEFRSLLGNPLNAVLAGQQPAGRREINWDAVPATVTNTNTFPPNFFNTNSTRGLIMTSGGSGFRVSDNNFADVNSTYSTQFAPFSPTKTFGIVGGNTMDVTFQVAGATTAASTNGFGVIFSDVDNAGSASIEFFSDGSSYGRYDAPVRCDATGLSFIGVAWNDSERITRVRITAGTAAPSSSANDVSSGGSADVVVMDDFFYGEPMPSGNVLTAALLGSEEVGGGDPDGTGFAVVTLDTTTNRIHYAIAVQNVDAPTQAHIHTGGAGVNGGVLVNFAPTFTNGIATGSVQADATTISNILSNASAFYVNVHNAAFPGGAVRGQLSYREINPSRLVFPVVGRVAGAAGAEYRADVRLVNLSGLAADVLLEYYAAGTVANAAPTATANITIAPGEQELLDNVVKTVFNVDSGTGAMRVISSRPITGTARIYNDQRTAGRGTFGQFTLAGTDASATNRGLLPMLSNQPVSSGAGSRTNIGWFNHETTLANVTFRAHDNATGAVIATSAPIAIPSMSQFQVPITALFPTLANMDNLYVTFDSDNRALFVYASVADNVNGDAIFIPAQAR